MIETSHHFATILTPPGAGAIGVIRVSGPDAIQLVNQLLQSRRGHDSAWPLSDQPEWLNSSTKPNRIRYAPLVDGDEVIDDVLVSLVTSDGHRSQAPAVDICAHGGVRILERILTVLERLGAPLSNQPPTSPTTTWVSHSAIIGEANEAFISAKTSRAVRFLAYQRKHLHQVLLEMGHQCSSDPQGVRQQLETMLSRFSAAEVLLHGAQVMLVGPVNSGKSTLYNQLIGRQAAVVSSSAGTTRDWVSGDIDLDGIPITLVDTAGLNDSADQLEAQAIRKGQDQALHAPLKILVLDGSQSINSQLSDTLLMLISDSRTIVVINKADLPSHLDLTRFTDLSNKPPIHLSAINGEGLEGLAREMACLLGLDHSIDHTPALFTARQQGIGQAVLTYLPDQPDNAQQELQCFL